MPMKVLQLYSIFIKKRLVENKPFKCYQEFISIFLPYIHLFTCDTEAQNSGTLSKSTISLALRLLLFRVLIAAWK